MTNWQATPLGEILSRSNEIAGIQPEESYKEITVKLWGKGVVLRGIVSGSELNGSRRFLARKGQLILSRIDARNGAIGMVPESLDGSVVSNDFPLFALDENRILPRYFEWLSKTKPFVELCQKASEGTTNRVRLQEDRFLNLQIPLPPLPEQRRIVARIEELAAKINDARGLRQCAAGEAEALITAQLRGAYLLQAKRYGSTRLEQFIAEAGYGSSEKCSPERDEGAVPVLRIPNVASERIDLDGLKFALLSTRDRQRLNLANGDILIVRTNGSLDLVGRSAVIDDLPEPMAFASYMIRLRFDSSTILPTYAQRMLRHLRMSGQLIDFARTTAGQYNVSLGRLRSAEIPVPPLAHQHRIVAELDALQSQVDGLKKLQAETATELDALMPAILDKAFRGQL